jgi:hypothetical protein
MGKEKSSKISKVILVLILLALVIGGSDFLIFYYGPPPPSQACRRLHVQVLQEPEPVQGQVGSAVMEGGIAAPAGEELKISALEELSPQAGFGIASPTDAMLWARRLGAGWYLDWAVQYRPEDPLPEHWQMVRLYPDGCVYPSMAAIRWVAFHNRGQVWVIGNEPDVIWQDDVTPEAYAQAYHELYTLIKKTDPRASVAAGSIAQATPLRLAYLDRVLAAYQNLYGKAMPVDWWTVHGYVLREERGSWGVDIPPGLSENQGELYNAEDHGRLDLFKTQVVAFREWMATNGYRDKPLALTEFGILLGANDGYTPDKVVLYLRQTISWLATASDEEFGYPGDGNRLVQRWAWFSLADRFFPTSDLANLGADTLTVVGQAYREYNLLPVK